MSAADRDPRGVAQEYVLGLLEEAEAREVEAALATDEALAREVAAARDSWLEIDAAAGPVEPSPELWGRIRAQLGRAAKPEASGVVTPFPAPAGGASGAGERGTGAAAAPRAARPRPWFGVAGWATAAALALVVGWQALQPRDPDVIAVLLNEKGDPLALVEDYGGERARVVPLADLGVPEGKSLEVWTLPDPDAGPVSLGLLPQPDTTTLRGLELPRPESGQLYEITVEDEGGSPTGGPTGPIVGKGFARVPR